LIVTRNATMASSELKLNLATSHRCAVCRPHLRHGQTCDRGEATEFHPRDGQLFGLSAG